MTSVTAAIFRVNPIEVRNRLEELGWTLEELIEIVGTMVSARHSCTDNDPTCAPGWMAWKDGSRRLREIGRAKGLQKSEIDQIPCVVDVDRKLRFSVSNTDDGTSLAPPRIPQNCSKKGPGTDRVVTSNQGSLFDYLDAPMKVAPLSMAKPQPGILVSWFLCTYCAGDEIRAELSCPIGVHGGFFTDFLERLVLIGPDDDGGAGIRRILPDDGPEFDIPVTRK